MALPSTEPAKKRKPRLTADDYALIREALYALIGREQDREVEFAQECLTVPGPDDQRVPFGGGWAELCEVYQGLDRPVPSSEEREAALTLLAKLNR